MMTHPAVIRMGSVGLFHSPETIKVYRCRSGQLRRHALPRGRLKAYVIVVQTVRTPVWRAGASSWSRSVHGRVASSAES